eukprot:gb/GEZN01006831.1/.p1 GENE.gb/GEZN01006831.1/~~gb/GEZN01006831.1/.p1  ORF type:complete len:345 (+),score=31.58 gb/GEZN01006831.1/:74-1108(+)
MFVGTPPGDGPLKVEAGVAGRLGDGLLKAEAEVTDPTATQLSGHAAGSPGATSVLQDWSWRSVGPTIWAICSADRSWPLPFASLDKRLQRKFYAGGCRQGEKLRDASQAQVLFSKVPRLTRTSNQEVLLFLNTRDASHIQPHGKDVIHKAEGFNPLNDVMNLEWELAGPNRRRGAARMTVTELRELTRINRAEAMAVWRKRATVCAFDSAFTSFCLHFPLALADAYCCLDKCSQHDLLPRRQIQADTSSRVSLRMRRQRAGAQLIRTAFASSCVVACTSAVISMSVSVGWAFLPIPERLLTKQTDPASWGVLLKLLKALQLLGWFFYVSEDVLPRLHRLSKLNI